MLQYKVFNLLSGFETNTYLVWEDEKKDAILIDPAEESEVLLSFIRSNNFNLNYIINTHGHGDHIGGNEFFKKHFHAKTCIHKDDNLMLTDAHQNLSVYFENSIAHSSADILLKDGDVLVLGNTNLKVIHTPGHTRGCISLYADNLLLSGDTLFYHDIGRTDLPGGNEASILTSIRNKLLVLPDETIVLPGHGPASTIKEEKLNNPYI